MMPRAAVVPKCGSSRWELRSSSLPDDIALNIASLLEVSDLCSLGSCSRFWRDICLSDCLWIDHFKKRWPSLDSVWDRSHEVLSVSESSQTQGWKEFYIRKHKQNICCASSVVKFVEECSQNGSLEVRNYLRAIDDLWSTEFGFKDVQLFLLARNHGVLLNLIGLHYSILWLRIPPSDLMEALRTCQVSERKVLVNWFKFGRWFNGFRLPDEHSTSMVSLSELAMADKDKAFEVLSVLGRGAVHEVIRVRITPCQIPDSES